MYWIPELKPITIKKKWEVFSNKQGLSVKFKPSAKCRNHPVPLHFLSTVEEKIQGYTWKHSLFSESIFDNISQISDAVQSADVSHYSGN